MASPSSLYRLRFDPSVLFVRDGVRADGAVRFKALGAEVEMNLTEDEIRTYLEPVQQGVA